MSTPTAAHGALPERITAYLSGGGLFNPELANHDAVRDLLIDCRAALSPASPAPAVPVISAATRDALLDVAINFIGTLTGMKPPPIEIAPPEVFAPFRAFVADVERIVLAATPAQQTQSDAVAGAVDLRFHLCAERLPDVAQYSSSYGGQWSSEWCIVVDGDGHASNKQFTVAASDKDALGRGECVHSNWKRKGYVAWAYYKDVAAALHTATPPQQATPSAVVTLKTMESETGKVGYYLDHPAFYCDVSQDDAGQWSVFIRDKRGREGFAEQATPSAAASIKPDVQGTPTIASTAPERIWLDLGEGVDRHEPGVHFRECHEVTWSEDNATCNGIEYVRAALKEAPGGGT